MDEGLDHADSGADAQPEKSGGQFTCSNCGGTFEKGRTDAEAMAESRDQFGDVPMDDLWVICSECYEDMFGCNRYSDDPILVS